MFRESASSGFKYNLKINHKNVPSEFQPVLKNNDYFQLIISVSKKNSVPKIRYFKIKPSTMHDLNYLYQNHLKLIKFQFIKNIRKMNFIFMKYNFKNFTINFKIYFFEIKTT